MKEYAEEIDKFNNKNVLVIGDSMLDKYISGNATRISPEAPVPVIEQKDISYRLGGAANVSSNIITLGAKSSLVSVTGEDIEAKEFYVLAEEKQITTSFIYKLVDRPTTVKTRILAGHQQIVRLDREIRKPIDAYLRSEIIKILYDLIPTFDAVVISDYGKGMLNMELVPFIIERCLVSSRPVVIDPIPENAPFYKNATLLTPNKKEAEKISGMEIIDDDTLKRAGMSIIDKLNPEYLLVTLGEDGMALFEKGKELIKIPTVSKDVYDVTGAGDLVCSIMALCFSAEINFYDSAYISNIAAGIEVTKLGNVSVSVDELKQALLSANKSG